MALAGERVPPEVLSAVEIFEGNGMRITLLGSGDAFHGGGRAHSAALLQGEPGPTLLVDCGPTAPLALARAGIPPSQLDAVLVTHLHGDHTGGIPFLFLDALYRHPRTKPLRLLGPLHLASRVEALFRALYLDLAERPRPFAVEWEEIGPGETVTVAGARVTALAADHMRERERALAFRVALGEGERRRLVAFSGDTGPGADLEALADGADLFVCECALPRGGTGGRHLSVDEIERRRPGWTARRVVLTHLSSESRAEAESIAGVTVGDDGAVFEL